MSLQSVQQVAEYLGVSRTTIKRLIESGDLRAVPISRGRRKTVYRIRTEVLERWIMVKERDHARTVNKRTTRTDTAKPGYMDVSDTPTIPPRRKSDA